MKQFLPRNWRGLLPLIIMGWMAASLFGAGSVWGEVSSGMSLSLFTDEDNYPNHQYLLGVDAVEIIMVVKNENGWSVNTDRGFTQVDLHQSLVLTDPNGTKHSLSEEGALILDVPPAISWNNRPTSEAESLPADWVRSVTIDDLRDLFPMLNNQPGWYTLEAHQTFARFAWTVQAEPVGLLGIQDDPNNWSGTIDALPVEFFIAPASGGRVHARVRDTSSLPAKMLTQVPVRVFKKSDLPPSYVPETQWSKTRTILEGTTNPEGWTVWDSEQEVQCLAEAEYVVMARYLDQVEEAMIPTGATAGWATGCDGLVSIGIYFGGSHTPGDFDGDGDFDGKDLAEFAAAFARHDPIADLNNDGGVNPDDIGYFADKLGQEDSPPPAPAAMAAPMAAGSAALVSQAVTADTDSDTDKKLEKKKNKRNIKSRRHKRRKKNK